MKNNVLVLLLLLISSTSFADVRISVYSESLDSIANDIFQESELSFAYIPSESEYKSLNGLQYLYCSISADILFEKRFTKRYTVITLFKLE